MTNTLIKIICAFSVFCGILLYHVSCNFKEFISGILASIAAACIFFLLTDVLPYYMRRIERAKKKFVAYRNLQIFLSRLDGVFFHIYCERYGMDPEKSEFSEIEKQMQVGDFYHVSMIGWLAGVSLRPSSCGSDLRKKIKKEWKNARKYANRALSSTYASQDPTLEYLLSHLTFDHPVNILFRMMKKNPGETYRADCLLTPICGKVGDREKAVQDIISLHEHAMEMYRDLVDVKEVSEFRFPPPFYRDVKPENPFYRKFLHLIASVRRSTTVIGILFSLGIFFVPYDNLNFSTRMFFGVSAVVLMFKHFCESHKQGRN